MGGGQTRNWPVPGSARAIPSGSKAYAANVTVLPLGPLGYLTIWPSDSAQPFVSTLNSLDAAIVANAAIVPSAADGSVSTFVTNPSDVILDISGYFAP